MDGGEYHCYTRFKRGGQNALTEAIFVTASVERSRLIVVLSKAVARPPQLIN
jgi:hypothetical protein